MNTEQKQEPTDEQKADMVAKEYMAQHEAVSLLRAMGNAHEGNGLEVIMVLSHALVMLLSDNRKRGGDDAYDKVMGKVKRLYDAYDTSADWDLPTAMKALAITDVLESIFESAEDDDTSKH